jgi:hypothetical protein
MSLNVPLFNISKDVQHNIVQESIIKRDNFQSFYSIRYFLENIDRNYYRELDWTTEHARAQLANRSGDTSRYQNYTVPVVMPQVESNVSYLTSVFLTGNPIFGIATSPEYIDQAIQLEAIIANQQIKFGWKAELIKFFRDCAKYNIGAVECIWQDIRTPSFEDPKTPNVIWSGNRLTSLDLYNSFWDTLVAPSKVHTDGEYAGYSELITRVKLKEWIRSIGNDVIGANINPAFESTITLRDYYVPEINPESIKSLSSRIVNSGGGGAVNWFAFVGLSEDKKAQLFSERGYYIKTTIYKRIIPSDFGLKVPEPNTPQIFKFVLINWSILLFAERQTNVHEYIPIIFGTHTDDKLSYQTKSLAENVTPIQQLSSTFLNSSIAARRRSIADRALYNPLYLNDKDINNPNPTAKIPLKSNGYGQVKLNDIYFPIPFNDTQSAFAIQEIGLFSTFADTVSGQNKAQQGQFVKGNKTLHEYEDIMGNANAKNQTIAIVLEDGFFTPVKSIIASNILQYQEVEDLYHEETTKKVTINPVLLRNAIYKFKVSDGLTPTDKLINADSWKTAIQVLGSSPQIAAEYNIGGIFSYLLKSQGANVGEFQKSPEQIQFEQQMGAWQQAVETILKANPQATTDNFPPQPTPPQVDTSKNPKQELTIMEQMLIKEQMEEQINSGEGVI